MRKRLARQIFACILVIAAFVISGNSGVKVLQDGTYALLGYMMQDNTADDIRECAEKGMTFVSELPAKAGKDVETMVRKDRYSEPVDEKNNGRNTAVHAVGAGQVTAVGDSEEIGKYIKITHEGDGESLYGNLSSTLVKVPENVKKGQIIGVYNADSDKKFYYSFRDFQ